MQHMIRTMVRGAYDVQKLRIMMGNRIVINFKAKLGQSAGTAEEELDEDAKRILADLRIRYDKITDGVKSFPRQTSFKGDEVISTYTELCLVAQYLELERDESAHFRRLGNVLREVPIYTAFLESVRGIGPAMAGVIVSEIDITKARHVSSLWKYAGLDVAQDGKGRSRKGEHLVDVEYTSKDGEIKQKKSITFNPFLKTKLVGVMGGSFIKAGNERYRKVYDDYKHRLENHAVYKDHSKGHRHNMAVRYMVKVFLADLWVTWRTLENLPVTAPYHEAKLGLKHAA